MPVCHSYVILCFSWGDAVGPAVRGRPAIDEFLHPDLGAAVIDERLDRSKKTRGIIVAWSAPAVPCVAGLVGPVPELERSARRAIERARRRVRRGRHLHGYRLMSTRNSVRASRKTDGQTDRHGERRDCRHHRKSQTHAHSPIGLIALAALSLLNMAAPFCVYAEQSALRR